MLTAKIGKNLEMVQKSSIVLFYPPNCCYVDVEYKSKIMLVAHKKLIDYLPNLPTYFMLK